MFKRLAIDLVPQVTIFLVENFSDLSTCTYHHLLSLFICYPTLSCFDFHRTTQTACKKLQCILIVYSNSLSLSSSFCVILWYSFPSLLNKGKFSDSCPNSLTNYLKLLFLSNTLNEAALQTPLLVEWSYICPWIQLSPLCKCILDIFLGLTSQGDDYLVPTSIHLWHVQKGRTYVIWIFYICIFSECICHDVVFP